MSVKKSYIVWLFLAGIGLSIGCVWSSYAREQAITYVDFDESMQLQERWRNIHPSEVETSVELYKLCKYLYQKNQLQPGDEPKIPKIIHQVWLGSPFPEKYRAWQQSWIQQHPDWIYILWDDERVKQLKLHNQREYDACSGYGERSDIVRYEVLYQFGGLYIDTDFECLDTVSFDPLVHAFDFFAGLTPLWASRVQIANGLIASRPHHPLLRCIIEAIPIRSHFRGVDERTGPIHFSTMLYGYAKEMRGVGQDLGSMIIFPAGYFYPGTRHDKTPCPESLAVHHWETSWMQPCGIVHK